MKFFNALVGVATILSGAAAIAQWAGISFDGALGTAMSLLLDLLPILVFFLGLIVGYAFGRRRAGGTAPKPRKLTEAQARELVRSDVKKAEPWVKVLLKATAVEGCAYADLQAWRRGFGGYGEWLEKAFLDPETLTNGSVRLSAKEGLKRLYEDSSDLFDVVSEDDMEARAVYDPERRSFPSFVRSGEPRWWWYADEPVSNAPITALAHKKDAADCGGRDRAAGRPRRWNVFDATPEDLEEAERLRKEAKERDEAAYIASLDFWEKALLKTALTKRNVYCSSNDFRQMQSCGAGVSFEDYPVTVGHGVVRIKMTKERRRFLERHPEALEAVRDEDVAEHKAGRLPKYRDRNAEGFSVDPDWWYYDDEQEEEGRDEA